jgi:hypothetical protein
MSFKFSWNIYADQPHNVVPRKERIWYHLRHAGSYLSLAASNVRKAAPILIRYRELKKRIYKNPVHIKNPFALSVSPNSEKATEILESLKEIGIQKSLIRVPSWERKKLASFKKFSEFLFKNGIEVTIALLQRRDDILEPIEWESFIEEVFSEFQDVSSFFEIGHAWNRTKWGIWDYKEYLKLALPARSLAEKYKASLLGPAVIDFEFHLYPPVLSAISFDKVSSLLYVDRVGAPESRQFGWDTSKKLALLKAVVDGCSARDKKLWITEVNWPLKGTGKYSPASGRPNVSEDDQANYLVRYYILCLASGLVERIYWWQLVAPGYGLIDSREREWRRRPSFYAYKNMAAQLEGSTFTHKIQHSHAEMFSFQNKTECFAVCWTTGKAFEYTFERPVIRAVERDGKEIPIHNNQVEITGKPKYIFFQNQ